jgi:hypothetical protein
VVSELKDLSWALSSSFNHCQEPTRIIVQIKNVFGKPSDPTTSLISSMEHQFASSTAKIHASNADFNQRLTVQEANWNETSCHHDYQFEHMMGEFQSLKATVIQAQPPTPPYCHSSSFQPRSQHHSASTYPHHDISTHRKHHLDNEFQPPLRSYRHHDEPRREYDWHNNDFMPRWHIPRAELPKFDDSNVVDWIEDCELPKFDDSNVVDSISMSHPHQIIARF